MKPGEQKAHVLIAELLPGHIQYEPIQNAPPDFLVNDIAIEVTRLTKSISSQGQEEVVDSSFPSLAKKIERLITELSKGEGCDTYFVSFSIDRPFIWQDAKESITKYLSGFRIKLGPTDWPVVLDGGVTLYMMRGTPRPGCDFILGGRSDGDASGFVVSDVFSNLQRVSAKKLYKIEPFKMNYREWWLVLENTLAGSISDESFLAVVELVSAKRDAFNGWDKIIIFQPDNPKKYWLVFEK
ncbi:hypothetical protein [Roseivivax lentus]|uniref:hypothetical protein n=1 Tax=Roseivivax lentus TaxID=633194 RepID=UPI00117BCED6|nr:hypothetical protein [Roseivivax lentus]